MEVEKIVEFLKQNGAGALVPRTEVRRVSCGLLCPGTLANDDSRGKGPREIIRFGEMGRVSYPVEALAEYMARRGLTIEKNT